jgi:nicotinate-nucleotide pyrophosphorylase (carboxylating)
MNEISYQVLLPQILQWLEEDDLHRNFHYLRTLPDTPVKLTLKLKSPLMLAGTDWFIATFRALGADAQTFSFLTELEGKKFNAGEVVEFPATLPFRLAVSAERLALNLLQHASSIATWTGKHAELARQSGVRILDTRKTTPGMRSLEKYAVRVGGGFNHRLGQTDTWMIKDNHKSSLGGLAGAYAFFQQQGTFYTNIMAEIHDLKELAEAIELGIRHVMLDNFTPADIRQAVEQKIAGMTYEVSGGIKLDNLSDYLIPGVDAISLGSLTYSAPRVDISLKFRKA